MEMCFSRVTDTEALDHSFRKNERIVRMSIHEDELISMLRNPNNPVVIRETGLDGSTFLITIQTNF
jgi:hypothetical protein